MVKRIKDIEEFNACFHQPTTHAMVSVGNLAHAIPTLFEATDFGMYCVVLMETDFGRMWIDERPFNYCAGSVFALSPGQVVRMNQDYTMNAQGWMLAFRPELLVKSGLGRDFYMFNFFGHNVEDALELSESERGILLNCFSNIYAELHTPADYLSNHMLRLGIGHLLSYCKRFFERQYDERKPMGLGIVEKLSTIIDSYLSSGMPAQQGQPTVAWCAGQFNLSPNYFGEVVKRELHVTATDYIQGKIVQAAETLLRDTTMSIGEIAEELGFAYPSHFTRMFHRRTGFTPVQYRQSMA